ncbi:hypothetical protein FRC01_001020, partial [Tulasnella sp. 417]
MFVNTTPDLPAPCSIFDDGKSKLVPKRAERLSLLKKRGRQDDPPGSTESTRSHWSPKRQRLDFQEDPISTRLTPSLSFVAAASLMNSEVKGANVGSLVLPWDRGSCSGDTKWSRDTQAASAPADPSPRTSRDNTLSANKPIYSSSGWNPNHASIRRASSRPDQVPVRPHSTGLPRPLPKKVAYPQRRRQVPVSGFGMPAMKLVKEPATRVPLPANVTVSSPRTVASRPANGSPIPIATDFLDTSDFPCIDVIATPAVVGFSREQLPTEAPSRETEQLQRNCEDDVVRLKSSTGYSHVTSTSQRHPVFSSTEETDDQVTWVDAVGCKSDTYFAQSAKEFHIVAPEVSNEVDDDLNRANDALGHVYRAQCRYTEAEESYTRAQEIYARIGDGQGRANTLDRLGDVYRAHCRDTDAEESYTRAQEIYARIGDDQGRANTL